MLTWICFKYYQGMSKDEKDETIGGLMALGMFLDFCALCALFYQIGGK